VQVSTQFNSSLATIKNTELAQYECVVQVDDLREGCVYGICDEALLVAKASEVAGRMHDKNLIRPMVNRSR
jgi:hypothetical protein